MSEFDPGAAAHGDGIYGLPSSPDDARVVLIPVPWEPTTSYRRGTAGGPAAILAASKQVDLFDVDFGRVYEAGIAMLDADPEIVRWNAEASVAAAPILAAGGATPDLANDLAYVNGLSQKLNDRVFSIADALLQQRKIVGVVGGDHSAPYGAIAACAARFPGLGVLHFDAHADLRRAYEGFTDSHASILFNVVDRLPGVARVVQLGVRDFSEEERDRIAGSNGRIHTYFDADLARRGFAGEPFGRVVDEAIERLPDRVYVTFDIDGLDPSLCPHTGTPVPGGLSFREATFFLSRLASSGRTIVGFDLNEVAPGPEGDEWDGNVGARLLYKLIGAALRSRVKS